MLDIIVCRRVCLLTLVLFVVGMGNSAVGKDHFKVNHIAGRPAILRAEEAQPT